MSILHIGLYRTYTSYGLVYNYVTGQFILCFYHDTFKKEKLKFLDIFAI